MRAIVGRQFKLFQQFNVQIVNQIRCTVWTQQSFQCSIGNKPSQAWQTKSLQLVPPIHSMCIRHKSKRSSVPSTEDSDLVDEDGCSVTLEKGPDFKDMRCKLSSLRVGSVAKAAFNISRTSAEKEFYSNKFRLNGKKVDKKSSNLTTGDTLDYIKQNTVPVSPDLVEVARVELLHVTGFDDDSSDLTVVLRRYPKLLLLREDFE